MILGDRARWRDVEVIGDDDGLLLVIDGPRRPTLLGRGDAEAVGALVARAECGPARWMSVPRRCAPGPDVLSGLDLAPFSTWDWLTSDTLPSAVPREGEVRRLDHVADADRIHTCLREANPGTSADPAGDHELGWWGVEVDGLLAGVVGVNERGGPTDGGSSWHVHGLGVLPRLRGAGLGAALTAAVTRAGLTGGASWVSLGMYAENDGARRLYHRLGYRTEAELASFGPAGQDRPPG